MNYFSQTKYYDLGILNLYTPDSYESLLDLGLQAVHDFEEAKVENATASSNTPGNGTFDFRITSGELFVGKTISLAVNISDPDGTTTSNVQYKLGTWDSSNGYDWKTSNAPYTLSESDIGKIVVYEMSYVDDGGSTELLGPIGLNFITGTDPAEFEQVKLNPANTPNTERTIYTYDQFKTHINTEGLAEDKIKITAGEFTGKWGGELGTAPTLTFSIQGAGALNYHADYAQGHSMYGDFNSFSDTSSDLAAIAFSEAEKVEILEALNDWSLISGINFVEKTSGILNEADIVFTKLNFTAWNAINSDIKTTSAGFAFRPMADYGDFIVGDIFLNSSFPNPFKQVVSHEIGHALGLAHPHDGLIQVGDGKSSYGDDEKNYNTVMSYDASNNFLPISPMLSDLQSMKALYGGNQSANLGNTHHVFEVDDFNNEGGFNLRYMLHDVGGTADQITLTSNTLTSTDTGVYLNLAPGTFSNFGSKDIISDDNSILSFGNFALSPDTEIEILNATVGDDYIDAKVNWTVEANLNTGDDIISTTGYGSILDGGDGSDRLLLRTDNYATLFVQPVTSNSGKIYSNSDSLFCEAADFEFVSILNSSEILISELTWSDFVTQYAPPTITATTGNDTLNGTSAKENIDGLAGDDVINGKGGDDVLTGAGGADKFVVAASDGGNVRIADFEDGVDSWEVTLVGGEKLSSATFNPENAADWGGVMKSQNEIGDNEWSIVGGLLTYKGGSLSGLNLPDPVYTPFEIVEIDGERYGDIITFGIKLKDSEVGNFSSDMFASISMQINWQDGEYEFFNYEAGISTPSGTDIVEGTADSGTYLGLENYDEANDYITIGALDPTGFTYGQDPTPAAIDKYLAKIMLTRTANNTSNDITLTKSNYSQVSDPLTISKPQPKDFTFDYSQDTVTVQLETPSGVVAPDPVLFVSSDTVTDGLSIVPVMKVGNIVKYEIVLNVSKPTVMKDGKTVIPTASIDIDDARIFDGSIVDKSGLAAGAEASVAVGAATFTVTDFLGSSLTVNDALSMPGGNQYSEHYFFDKLEAALDSSNTSVTMADLTTSRGMTINVAGLAEPIIAAIDLEDFTGGRYVLGEFTALAYGSGIEFGDDANDPSSMININARQVTNAEKASGYVTTVNDGSDIVLLGNSYYENPMTNQDAVGAEDALGALMIATDMLPGSSQAQMIAADFDESGDVSSWDAYNIMRYAVYGEETGGDYPTWSYIDNVEMVDPFLGPMTKDTVSFDNNIDLFVGSDTTINATAVLKGDVSDSYETLSSSIDPRAAWQTKFINEFNTTYDIKVDMSDTFTATDLVRVTGTSVADGERAAMLQISSSKTSSDTIKIDEHSYMNAIMLKGSYADATAVKTRLIDLDLQVGETAAGTIGTGDAIAIIYSADGTSMNKVAEMKFLGSVTKDTDFTTSTIIDVVDTTATLTFTGGVWETHDIVFIA